MRVLNLHRNKEYMKDVMDSVDKARLSESIQTLPAGLRAIVTVLLDLVDEQDPSEEDRFSEKGSHEEATGDIGRRVFISITTAAVAAVKKFDNSSVYRDDSRYDGDNSSVFTTNSQRPLIEQQTEDDAES
jgi:hypothetical protein